MEKVEEIATKGVQIYNKYRSPESTAELMEVKGSRIRVRFRGPFCRTCGIRDWVEDYAYFLEDLGVRARLVEYLETGDEERVGVFEVVGGEAGREGQEDN